MDNNRLVRFLLTVCLLLLAVGLVIYIVQALESRSKIAKSPPAAPPASALLPVSALALATTPPTPSPTAQNIDPAERTAQDSSMWIENYLRRSARRFPVGVVDRVLFFNPLVLDAHTILNPVQIEFSEEQLKKVRAPVLVEFLTRTVDLTQHFNCVNHREAIDRRIVIRNVILTREPDANDRVLPAIEWNGKETRLNEGFVTAKATCDQLKPREDLKVQEVGSAEDRLIRFLTGHKPSAFGTGWPLPNGMIVTNRHVADGSRRVYAVRNDRQFTEARVLVSDPIRDVSILTVDDPAFLDASFELSEGDHDIGESVLTVGYPWTSSITNRIPQPQLSQGIISSLPDNGLHFQLSMPIHGGNSGGPLITLDGKVAGIIVSKLKDLAESRAENVSFAIRISHLQAMLKNLVQQRTVSPIKIPPGARDASSIAPLVRDHVLLLLVL